jgi:hypothetical protein
VRTRFGTGTPTSSHRREQLNAKIGLVNFHSVAHVPRHRGGRRHDAAERAGKGAEEQHERLPPYARFATHSGAVTLLSIGSRCRSARTSRDSGAATPLSLELAYQLDRRQYGPRPRLRLWLQRARERPVLVEVSALIEVRTLCHAHEITLEEAWRMRAQDGARL